MLTPPTWESMSRLNKFENLIWKADRMLLGDLVFRLEHFKSEIWDGGSDYYHFFKTKELVNEYKSFFSHFPEFQPSHLFELGIYDGGSTVFWYEIVQPNKHIAIDILKRSDSPYFCRYIDSHGLKKRIKTFWGTDQSDKKKLRSIVTEELNGKLDLVIDDASHMYEPTRASFEALFPLCNPGALYIIEDWAWGHWPDFIKPDHPWAKQEVLTRLVIELVEAAGTSPYLISSIMVYQGFVVIERGPIELQQLVDFNLEDNIVRRSY